MTKFAGLCVGGPYAGRLYVGSTETIMVEERVGRMRLRPENGQSPVMNVKSNVYGRQQVGELGLWVHESMTLQQALAEIAAGYMEACKQADPRVTPSFTR